MGLIDLSPSNGFVSEPISVDFDINPAVNGQYVTDAIYFGTVEQNQLGFWQGGEGICTGWS